MSHEMLGDVGDGASLVVAFSAGAGYEGGLVKADQKVVDSLRAAADSTLSVIAAGGGGTYDPDSEQDDWPYLEVAGNDVGDPDLLAELRRGADLPPVGLSDLVDRHVSAHALILGDDPDDRWAFVQRYSPVKLASKSLLTYFDSALHPLDGPVLAFDPLFHVVFSPTQVWTTRQTHFEGLFKDSDAVLAHVESWVDNVGDQVPLSAESKELLTDRLRKNSVLRRKILSIQKRGHLSEVSVERLKEALEKYGMNPAEVMPEDEIVMTLNNVLDVVRLLNEDLFSGEFSEQDFAAGRKSPR